MRVRVLSSCSRKMLFYSFLGTTFKFQAPRLQIWVELPVIYSNIHFWYFITYFVLRLLDKSEASLKFPSFCKKKSSRKKFGNEKLGRYFKFEKTSVAKLFERLGICFCSISWHWVGARTSLRSMSLKPK